MTLHLKMSGKWWPFCSGRDELRFCIADSVCGESASTISPLFSRQLCSTDCKSPLQLVQVVAWHLTTWTSYEPLLESMTTRYHELYVLPGIYTIWSWTSFQPMREDVRYATSSVIGWYLAKPWKKKWPRPSLIELLTLTRRTLKLMPVCVRVLSYVWNVVSSYIFLMPTTWLANSDVISSRVRSKLWKTNKLFFLTKLIL